MKNVGIVGMPYSGKSTLFVALTGSPTEAGGFHQALVEVPDERLALLAQMESATKVVRAKVRFVDVPGGLTAQGIGEFREMEALCLVVRAFGEADPKAEFAKLQTELLLADLTSIESGLEKARKRARAARDGGAEVDVLENARSLLEAQEPLRDAGLGEDAAELLKGYGLLTLKPWVVVANVDEGAGTGHDLEAIADVTICASLEAEVAGMDEAEATELLAGFGIEQPAHKRLIAACYRALDLVTFFTTVHDETHAWAVRRGAKAPEAAGAIHSDMERGFIRAEVVNYADLVGAGSWDAAKAHGHMRVEGKDYVVAEGDVLHIRFAL